MLNAINGRAQLGCQCFLQSLRLELGAAPLPLFIEMPRRGLLGNSTPARPRVNSLTCFDLSYPVLLVGLLDSTAIGHIRGGPAPPSSS
jgi:hypothetical protein